MDRYKVGEGKSERGNFNNSLSLVIQICIITDR